MRNLPIGTLVLWTKTDPRDPRPEAAVTLPAQVNQVWPTGDVSLFVFSPDGQFIARVVPQSQIRVIAEPEQLANLVDVVPTLIQDHEQKIQLLQEAVNGLIEQLGGHSGDSDKGKKRG